MIALASRAPARGFGKLHGYHKQNSGVHRWWSCQNSSNPSSFVNLLKIIFAYERSICNGHAKLDRIRSPPSIINSNSSKHRRQ